MSAAFGQQIKESDMVDKFLTGPGQVIVANTLMQLSSVAPFASLFGPYTPGKDAQRWADYQRFDWSIRQLPAINIFEAETESKQSSNAYVTGAVNIQIFWPPNLRRSDLARVPSAAKAAFQNFFESQSVADMLDEIFSAVRPMKVPGLNEYGKNMDWSPNVEGVIDSQVVPVTMVSVKYRLDLRAWYRAMEFDDRTKEKPFERTLSDLKTIGGEYDGVLGVTNGPGDAQTKLLDEIVINP